MKFCSVVTQLWESLLILTQMKENNSCTTEANLLKLDVHHRVVVICIYFRFRGVPLCGYLFIYGFGGTDWHVPNNFPPPSAGITIVLFCYKDTVKILKFGTPKTIAIIVLKLVQFDVTLH